MLILVLDCENRARNRLAKQREFAAIVAAAERVHERERQAREAELQRQQAEELERIRRSAHPDIKFGPASTNSQDDEGEVNGAGPGGEVGAMEVDEDVEGSAAVRTLQELDTKIVDGYQHVKELTATLTMPGDDRPLCVVRYSPTGDHMAIGSWNSIVKVRIDWRLLVPRAADR